MYSRIWTCCYSYRVIYAKAMNKVPIKAIKKETASLLASFQVYFWFYSARARVVTHEVRHGTAKRGESDARSAARTAKKGGA